MDHCSRGASGHFFANISNVIWETILQVLQLIAACNGSVLSLIVRWRNQMFWRCVPWSNVAMMTLLLAVYGPEFQVGVLRLHSVSFSTCCCEGVHLRRIHLAFTSIDGWDSRQATDTCSSTIESFRVSWAFKALTRIIRLDSMAKANPYMAISTSSRRTKDAHLPCSIE